MAKPGKGRNALEVHSQTLPSMPRHPHPDSPNGNADTSATPPWKPSRFARVEAQGNSEPHGYSRRARAEPVAFSSPDFDGYVDGSVRAAISHSASVGSLPPTHAQYASASYHVTCVTGASGRRGREESKKSSSQPSTRDAFPSEPPETLSFFFSALTQYRGASTSVSYTHLTLPTTPYV